MGAIIESVASALGGGSVECAVAAGKRALQRAGRAADEVGLLIHSGVYPDGFIVEPANAAFIQRRIGANPRWGDSSTLSFDLNGGGCGFLAAIEVADGFLERGEIDCALVTASDADPACGRSGDFPFRAAGAALLLARGSADQGFVMHRSRGFPAFADRYSGRAEFTPSGALPAAALQDGHYQARVRQKRDFAERCVECAEPVLRELLCESGVDTADYLIASPHPEGFAAVLASRLDIPSPVPPGATSSEFHTAGIGVALEAARQASALAPGDRVLFAAVGAGLNVSASLYRVGELERPPEAGSQQD